MELQSLEMENWKCFERKTTVHFGHHEIIKQGNGTGKTSTFEAVQFAVTGKMPVGFNMNTIRYDVNRPARVFLQWLNEDGSQCSVERSFGGRNNVCRLVVNGEILAESVRTVDAQMAMIAPPKTLSVLWTVNLQSNDVLQASFLTDVVVREVIEDAVTVVNYLAGEVRRKQQEVTRFQLDDKLDVDELERQLSDVQQQLKGGERSNGRKLVQARAAKEAYYLLEQAQPVKEGLDDVVVAQWKSLEPQLKRMKRDLAAEERKRVTPLSVLNIRNLQQVVDLSREQGHCILCGGPLDEGHMESMMEEVKNGGRNEEKVRQLQEGIALVSSHTREEISLYDQRKQLQAEIARCPDWESVLNRWDEEKDRLWKELDRLQRLLVKAKTQQAEVERINKLNGEIEHMKGVGAQVKNWINDTVQKATTQLLDKASSILAGMNSRYQAIALMEKSFVVVVQNSDLALDALPVQRLSSGEKTLVALSLLLAVHDVYMPHMPLLFDETFPALDEVNLESVKQVLRDQSGQVVVITHDIGWEGL